MRNNDSALADYVDQRIVITGIFDKFGYNSVGIREWKVALLQDVYAEGEGKQIDIGHAWVQHAEELKKLDLGPGDRVKCNCRVKPYQKRLRVPNKDGLMIETRYSLCFPTDVEVLGRAAIPCRANPVVLPPLPEVAPEPALLPAPQPVPPRSRNPASLVLTIKGLAAEAGGWDNLLELVTALRG
jgi:hypothetical protein